MITIYSHSLIITYDISEWEGNDEWLRAQFRLYLEGMLAAVLTDG
jgi:hypothetical protein